MEVKMDKSTAQRLLVYAYGIYRLGKNKRSDMNDGGSNMSPSFADSIIQESGELPTAEP